jgi:hypothetical protein
MLELIDAPNRLGCLRMLRENKALFQRSPGSTHNHQSWPGGYLDHVQEIMNIAIVQFKTLDNLRPLPFTLSDLLLIVFLHDIEKPWRYIIGADGAVKNKPAMQTKAQHQQFRLAKLTEYGITLTPEQENGLKYVEGEIHDYTPDERKMGPLAAVAHVCDVLSARLWFEHPLEGHSDRWAGATRLRD